MPARRKTFSTIVSSSANVLSCAPGRAIRTQSTPGLTRDNRARTASRKRRFSRLRTTARFETRFDTIKQKRRASGPLDAVLQASKPARQLFLPPRTRLISFSFLKRLAGGNINLARVRRISFFSPWRGATLKPGGRRSFLSACGNHGFCSFCAFWVDKLRSYYFFTVSFTLLYYIFGRKSKPRKAKRNSISNISPLRGIPHSGRNPKQ